MGQQKKTAFLRLINHISAILSCIISVALFTAISLPLFAQTAEVKKVGVYYKNNPTSLEGMYCNWGSDNTITNRSFVTSPTPNGNQVQPDGAGATDHNGDPWVSSALIEYDQPFPNDVPEDNEYPNHCLALCMDVYCNNLPLGQATYSISFPLQQIRFEILKYYNNTNIYNPEAATPVQTIDLFPGSGQSGAADLSTYMCGSYECTNAAQKQKDSQGGQGWTCIGAEWVCDTGRKNSENPQSDGTIDCSEKKYGTDNYTECTENDKGGWCWNKNSSRKDVCGTDEAGKCLGNNCAESAYDLDSTKCVWRSTPVCGNRWWADGSADSEFVWNSNCMFFNHDGAESHRPITFCAAWDGNYEHSGEMGKSNGQFAFRGRVQSSAPGDAMISQGNIEIDSFMTYPAMNQIPIQVDVTNVHTVRSTPTVVGKITKVSAQPYTLVYRLSKDADVRVAIFDGETKDAAAYAESNIGTTYPGAPATSTTKPVRTLVDWQPRLGEGMLGDTNDKPSQEFENWDGRNDDGMLLPAGNYVVTIQAKSQDEWKGIDFSRAVTRQLSLDPLKLTDIQAVGLTKKSTAYATISYIPTESSTVYWEIYTPGTVFGGDNKQNEIDTNSAEPTGTPPSVKDNTGTLVYRSEENRTGRLEYTARWDGTCQVDDIHQLKVNKGSAYPAGAYSDSEATRPATGMCETEGGCPYYIKGCVRSYANHEKMANGTLCNNTEGCSQWFPKGAPMPDGNYVYVLWAEVPYNGRYYNLASKVEGAPKFEANQSCTTTDKNNECFTGVKTLKYNLGTLEVERGLVGITIQPVSYSTIGSSPTAYGLDPFIFKYALDRDAQAIASVQNTAGVPVRYLTPQSGTANVSQQLNTLSWDGRDEQGRMVAPGTYWFVVEAHDAMFPSRSNRASAVFPVDMYRLVDLTTTDVYGDSNARATISYLLSRAMNVQINIYNKDVVIPNYNNLTGDYNSIVSALGENTYTVTQQVGMLDDTAYVTLNGEVVYMPPQARTEDIQAHGGTYSAPCTLTYCDVWTVALRPDTSWDVTLTRTAKEVVDSAITSSAAWPPRVCNTDTDEYVFADDGHVDPAKVATRPNVAGQEGQACIYVNDETFTNYPTSLEEAADNSKLDVRLQPIKTFDRSAMKNGDGMLMMEEWDALYFYNPTPNATEHTPSELASCRNATERTNCPYETVPDGSYPFYVSARSNEPFSRYYYDKLQDGTMTGYLTSGEPFKQLEDVVQMDYLYATEKPVSKINVTRGPVYFLDGSVAVYPNAPQVFNASTGPTFIPPYEIDFSVSRAAEVEIAIVALKDGVCSPVSEDYTTGAVNATDGDANNLYPNNGTQPSSQSAATNANGRELKTNVAGQICKFLSTMTIANVGDFDANVVRKAYWDGTDHTGHYVTPGIYEVRLTARNYPNNGAYQPTVKSVPVNAQLFQVYDLLDSDSYAISKRNTDMHIDYQVSVPMKVAIQIFKPGTTIYDYSKGTLRNPTTGKEVKDIHEVLVKSIVGIRPSMTLIDEIWDGRDYAQQEVPDGTYPFRFVTSINGADIDTMTGEIIPGKDIGSANSNNAKVNTEAASDWKINYVADTYQYQNLHKATVAIGDGKFVCEDWEKTVFFYPNPLNEAEKGTLEITKMPVPGTMSIKYYNLAGDLVKDSNYECIDANNYITTMGKNLLFYPDNDPQGSEALTEAQLDSTEYHNVRNAAMRCKWNATNQHGKKVARGVYFGLVDFKAKAGREHCQKVVKIIVP